MSIARILEDGPRDHVIHITGVAAESTTVTPSTMSKGGYPDGQQQPTEFTVQQIWGGGSGLDLQFFWQATANELMWVMAASGTYWADFRGFTGIPNKAGAGKTGALIVTSIGTSGSYSVVLQLRKKYLPFWT